MMNKLDPLEDADFTGVDDLLDPLTTGRCAHLEINRKKPAWHFHFYREKTELLEWNTPVQTT